MGLPVEIEDGKRKLKLTQSGAVPTANAAYDLTEFNTLDTVNQGYTYYLPKTGSQFVLTSILAFSDKDVNDATDTIITVYESSGLDSATNVRTLLQFGMGKLTSLPIVPLNILVNNGCWVNAKTSDDDIHMTIMGHYITAIN